VLIGCGLRRDETARLQMADAQQREGRWVIVDLRGKGNRIRTVAMPPWAKALIDAWTQAAGITEGRIFRGLNRGGRLSTGQLDGFAIWRCVRKYARCIQVDLAPHDLRRTYAKLAHAGKAALEQIQISLGHGSIVTTERYLGVRQDLSDAPCDHLGLRVPVEPKARG
jgi:integrase